MTEAEWNTCTDPEAMLNCLRGTRRISERKARLFAVACCRQIWRLLSQEDSQQAVEIAELYADGRATASQLRTAERRATEVASALEWEATVLMRMRAYASKDAAQAAAEVARKRLSPKLTALKARAAIAATPERPKDQGNVLRDLLGPLPFREVPIDPAWLAWNGGTIPKLAEAIYEERTFESMPVLADALEEAGCDSEEMLFHCRQQGHLHVRGCWVLDLLLGKQ